MEKNYDSTADTLSHIKMVNALMLQFASDLLLRAIVHDASKLEEPEKSDFDRLTPILKTLKYGTDEYKKSLDELKTALTHHYENNSHHPEHYPNGVNGMTLHDLVEMFLDWKAAGQRTVDGSILKSIEINKDRFSLSPQLVEIFYNTAKHYGWK